MELIFGWFVHMIESNYCKQEFVLSIGSNNSFVESNLAKEFNLLLDLIIISFSFGLYIVSYWIIYCALFSYIPYQADTPQRVSGGIILAPEGINGSICGTRESVERVLGFIQSDERLKGLRQIESPVSPEEEAIHHGHTSNSPLAAGEDAPFRWDHVRVKLKKEVFLSWPMPCGLK